MAQTASRNMYKNISKLRVALRRGIIQKPRFFKKRETAEPKTVSKMRPFPQTIESAKPKNRTNIREKPKNRS